MHLKRLRAIAWLALISIFLTTAFTNMIKFAARPSLPPDQVDCHANEAAALLSKMQSETGDDLKKDTRQYIWLLLEAGKRKDAHDAAALRQPLRPDPSRYDEEYVDRLKQLACAELMHDSVGDMQITFQHLFEYDSRYLPETDKRIATDYNNLGLACLLIGQSSEDEKVRQDMFFQTANWFAKAEKGFAGSPSDILSIKENELLLAEACKDMGKVDRLHHQIDAMLFAMKGKAPKVTL
jgi:hypothetical protein